MLLNVMLQDIESSTALQHILKKPAHCNRSVARQVLNLIFKILFRRFPNVEDITQSILMEWKMWPSFLGMIGRYMHVVTCTVL